jgi:hypothetical protein
MEKLLNYLVKLAPEEDLTQKFIKDNGIPLYLVEDLYKLYGKIYIVRLEFVRFERSVLQAINGSYTCFSKEHLEALRNFEEADIVFGNQYMQR